MLDVLSIDFAGGLVFVQPLGDNSGTEEIDLEDVELIQKIMSLELCRLIVINGVAK